MTHEELSDEVRTLLLERIESIAELELLLLLYRSAPAAWDADRLALELRIEPRSAAEELAALAARGLVAPVGEGSRYHYAPATPGLAGAVDALAEAYAERRVTIVNFVYSKPADRIRVFADAFRLRKDDSDG